MTLTLAPSVLILSDDAALARRWRQSLSHLTSRVWNDPAEVPGELRLDVVVLHGEEARRRFHIAWPRVRETDFATVAIGSAGPADVSLADDASEAELRLSCMLLGEIVSLRRMRESESQLRQRLSQLAFIDPLTEIPNRRAWEEELSARASNCERESLCLAIIDLDQFKQINDELGHVTGDAVLVAAAQSLREQIRGRDFVARLGGDEFGLLLSPIDPTRAERVVGRVRAGMASRLTEAAGRRATASAGLAVWPRSTELTSPRKIGEQLYGAADRALHLAKQGGRDRARFEPIDQEVLAGAY